MGNQVAEVMARGDLVTDEIVIGLIEEQLDAGVGENGLIFDGFPRTLAQADALGALLEAKGQVGWTRWSRCGSAMTRNW